MKTIRVGVLFGGRSGEHEISLASARSVMQALELCDGYEVVPIGITRSGKWILGPGAHSWLISQTKIRLGDVPPSDDGKTDDKEPVVLVPDGGSRSLVPIGENLEEQEGLDVIFPVLHGPHGEDGSVQGFLELAGIPYVGCGVAASAVGMDKDLMKRLFRFSGLLTPDWIIISKNRWEKDRLGALAETEEIGFPSFVKPANLGSSVGINKATNAGELERAIGEAALYDTKIVVEKGINAREIECSVLGNETPEASIPGEIIPNREFYDYRAKYIDNASELIIPAPLTPEVAKEVRRISVLAFQALGCTGMARVDFLLERGTDRLFLNELNTIPGFTSISMYGKLWEASGIGYSELIVRLIQLAIQRHEERKKLLDSYAPPPREDED